MNHMDHERLPAWQRNLEIAGAGFFVEYRKRLFEPGIVFSIRRRHPGLSWADILLRVHAGREIILDRQDFDALAAIRKGHWPPRSQPARPRRQTAGRVRQSVCLVALGRGLFAGFVALYAMAAIAADASPTLVGLGALTTGLLAGWRTRLRHRARGVVGDDAVAPRALGRQQPTIGPA